jgi:hypothetical protein
MDILKIFIPSFICYLSSLSLYQILENPFWKSYFNTQSMIMWLISGITFTVPLLLIINNQKAKKSSK